MFAVKKCHNLEIIPIALLDLEHMFRICLFLGKKIIKALRYFTNC